MKNIAIVVLAVLLVGAGYVIAKERTVPPKPNEHAPISSVSPLPEAAEKALGAERAAVVAMVGYDGTVKLFTPSQTDYSQKLVPLSAKITSVSPMTIIAYEGSQCVVWAPARWINGDWIPGFCAKWVK